MAYSLAEGIVDIPEIRTPQRHLAPIEIQEFIQHEARLLNDRLFEEWLGYLTKDILYFAPIYRDQKDGAVEASIFYDDYELLATRIRRLRHPKIWSQLPAAMTVRLVSNIMVDDDFASTGVVHSNFIMLECRYQEQKVFGGSYEHVLRRDGDTWQIARKTIRIVNAEATHANIAVPF